MRECAETLILPQASSEFGMRREGEFLKDRFLNGEWVDTVWLAMLSEECAKSRSSPPLQRPA